MLYGGWKKVELATASCDPRRALHNALKKNLVRHDDVEELAQMKKVFFSGKLENLEVLLVRDSG